MNRRSRTGSRPIGLIVAGLLLIVAPAGFGIYLLRHPNASATTIVSNESGTESVAVSEEVYASVLDRPTNSTDNAPADVAPISERDSRIKVLLNGTPVSIANGEAVPLSDDLQVEVFVAPYPPTGFETDVDLYLMTADGKPVTGAKIDVMYDMLYMNHGPFQALPSELGSGHYLASYDLFMFGPWVLDTYIVVPGREESISLPISIYVWPN